MGLDSFGRSASVILKKEATKREVSKIVRKTAEVSYNWIEKMTYKTTNCFNVHWFQIRREFLYNVYFILHDLYEMPFLVNVSKLAAKALNRTQWVLNKFINGFENLRIHVKINCVFASHVGQNGEISQLYKSHKLKISSLTGRGIS